MTALAIGYAAEYIAGNGPYWEPDVAYLHWSTDVPAVTVCRKTEVERLARSGHRSVHVALNHYSFYLCFDFRWSIYYLFFSPAPRLELESSYTTLRIYKFFVFGFSLTES